MLRTESVKVLRKGRVAVADASIEVGAQEAVAIVGPNGAGKSTLLRAISGLNTAATGRISYAGQDITHLSPRAIVGLGLVQVPEGRQLFPELTVQQNIWMGGFLKPAAARQANMERMFALFPQLAGRRNQLAGSLSGGEQAILAISRALASEPRILLLDEPSVGLSPLMICVLGDVVRAIQAQGIAILLVEQNITLARQLTTRAYVLVTGRIAAAGSSADVLLPARLSDTYLGAERETQGSTP